MKRRGMVLALLFATELAHGMGWADLWSRPEQQTLPRRQQAYSEIQGQQFEVAAEHLKPFADPVSQYNRGNALAHTGDLKAAISAYDAVLHGRALDASLQRDAQHNRDLIEQQMKSQPQSDKQGQKNDKNQQDSKAGEDGNGSKDNKPTGAGNDERKNDKGDRGQGDKNQSEKAQDKREQPANGAGEQSAGQPPTTGPSKQQPEQAEPNPKNPATQSQAAPADARTEDGSPPARAEQTQSLDQWLRWIPDDPAGLLRRKFMIEHMRHQGEGQQ
jgi:Ca-activated chloride channel family protein